MSEIELYKLLKRYKYKLSKQQYNTIKGQIKANDLDGAFKGIKTILNRSKLWK